MSARKPPKPVRVVSVPLLGVDAPYSRAFIEAVKEIDGRWNPQVRLWTVPEANRVALRNILIEVYDEAGGL